MKEEISDYILDNDCEKFKKDVLSVFQKLEGLRLGALKKYRKKAVSKFMIPTIFIVIVIIISSLISFTQILVYFLDYKNIAFGLFLVSIAAFIIMVFLFFDTTKKADSEFAEILKKQALKQLFKENNNIRWIKNDPNTNRFKQNSTIDDNELKKSGLFLPYNERYTDDEFEGTYKNVPFKISETCMHNVQRNNKGTICFKIFKGIIMSFNFNKEIKNHTIVSTKGDFIMRSYSFIVIIYALIVCYDIISVGRHYMLIGIGILLAVIYFCFLLNKKIALNEVKLEDPKFVKRFNIYSSDQIEARYLVTPSFMECFYNLKTAFGTEKIKCSFYDDKLMIAIYTNKDMFEIGGLFKPLEDSGKIEKFYKELSSVYKMIDYFKLNEKIYLLKNKEEEP